MKQKGMSTASLLIVLAVAGIGLMALFKIGPHYLDNYFVGGALDSLSKDPKWHEQPNRSINSALQRQFTVNNIRDIKQEDISIVRGNGKVILTIAYERRGNFLGNLDYVVSFENTVEGQ